MSNPLGYDATWFARVKNIFILNEIILIIKKKKKKILVISMLFLKKDEATSLSIEHSHKKREHAFLYIP